MLKSGRIKWGGCVAHMEQKKSVYECLVGTREGKRQTVRSKRRWENDIEMDVRVVGYDDLDWIHWLRIGRTRY
jgi:hypothetical protein